MHKAWLMLIRMLFGYAGNCCPGLFARWGIHLWGKTRRPPWRNWERRLLESASHQMLSTQYGPVATYCWGHGEKNVLLLPGWNSRASHFRSFIEQLIELDYRVISMDPPGHGQSAGNRTNIRQYLETIEHVHQQFGPFEAVIGHSFGGFCIPFAMNRFQLARKAVLLATPVNLEWLFTRFCNIIHASRLIRHNMASEVRQLLGENCWNDYDIAVQAPNIITVPSLIIHDDNDTAVPLDHARLIQSSWPGSRLVITRGLGHQRVLRHSDSVQPAIAFIRQD